MLPASAKQRVALGSLVASGLLTVAKLVIGLLTGSLGVLAEAGHSLMDFAATALTLWAVRAADKPADAEHPYGHAKIENLTALAETVLLFLVAGFIMIEAVRRLLGEHVQVDASPAAVAVLLSAIVIDFWRARALTRVAKETSSAALEADALHFKSDMVASATALAGLGGVALGFPQADTIAALVVACFIAIAGYRLARRTVDVLVDAAPKGVAETITQIVARLDGVIGVEHAKVRPAGAALFVDLGVIVPRSLPLDQVPPIKAAILTAVRQRYPSAEMTIVANPARLDDETVLERIGVIARSHGLMVHHVTVHDLRDKKAISLDLEVDGALPLSEAHRLASGLEEAIEGELGGDVEVETHIEPLDADEAAGQDVGPELRIAIAAALVKAASEAGATLRNVHDVRARATPQGLVVVFHGLADAELSVHAVHAAVDEIERRLRKDYPDIARIVGHAEPDERAGGSSAGAAAGPSSPPASRRAVTPRAAKAQPAGASLPRR